jgi:predicted permease
MNSQYDPDRSAIEIIARLKPNVTLPEAQAEAASRWTQYERASPDAAERHEWLSDSQLELQSIARGVSPLRNQFGNSLTLILAGAGLLLFIVSFNVGGLSLARSLARQKETALRLALGASRARIIRHMLAESMVIAGFGGTFGILFASIGIPIFLHWVPPLQAGGGELRSMSLAIHPDLRGIAFCMAVSGLAAVLSALAPAWGCSQLDLQSALKTTIGDLNNSRFQLILCGLQVALCTLLLLCAGLIVHSLRNLRAVNPGFDRDHVATFSIDPRMRRYSSEQTWLLQQRLLDLVRRLSGVQAAGIANTALMRGVGMKTSVVLPSQTLASHELMNSSMHNVTPGYLDALGIPVLEGRPFSPQDLGRPAPEPVLVNEAFVRRFLNGGDPLGRRFATEKQFSAAAF